MIKLNAQNINNERHFVVNTTSDTLASDTLTIIQNTIKIIDLDSNTPLDSTQFNIKNNLIILKHRNFKLQTSNFKLSYRVLPINLGKPFFRLDSSKIDRYAPPSSVEYADYTTPSLSNQLFDKSLDYSGNYTQGFSLGTNQNLVVNQNFNLNLAGKIGDLDVLAAMTDNNLPIQAEGNTQQLREFDRIYIQLKKGKNSLIAGDYELKSPNSYFTNYYKKLQGGTFSNTTNFLFKTPLNHSITKPQTATLSSRVSAAVARGKFARSVLPVSEGNQGPFRLLATEGVVFFIVLSGTEKVFFDGKLLTRGEENDYVIDYNRGDIMFTPKRLVTKDSRIVVEFEYADQSYLRTTTTVFNELIIKKLRLNFSVYNEQDSKNSSGTQALDSLDKVLLRGIGNAAATPLSIRTTEDGFRADRVQYKLVDYIIGSRRYTDVLVYSTNPDSARFTASFTPVGDGNGNYIQEISATNGRVYKWIAPDSATGFKRGAFEPIRKLVPPTRQQLTTFGAEYPFSDNTKLTVEGAMSNNDANRFSTKGDSINRGFGIYSNLKNSFYFDNKKKYSLTTDIKFEATQATFKPLNPYRNAEFTRDWNLPLIQNNQNATNNVTIGNLNTLQQSANEQFILGLINFTKNNYFSTIYEYGNFKRGLIYNGEKHNLRFNFDHNNWQFNGQYNDLNTNGIVEKTHFTRPNVQLSKTIKNNIKFITGFERERNERRDKSRNTSLAADTLTRASFAYDLWKIGFERPYTEGVDFGINFSKRFDYQPFLNKFNKISDINELAIRGNVAKNPNSILNWNLTYRDLKVNDSSLTILRPQTSYLGRIEYNFRFWENLLGGSSLYEIGSGQEQKVEYQYVKVNKGEGQYVWRNRNTDTIPQLDEFEIAPFKDQADYVRVSLFTNQFIRTNNVSFAQSLRFDPKMAGFANDSSLFIRQLINRFSTNSNVQIARRVKNEFQLDPSLKTPISQWNPFQLNIPDIALVALTLNLRNSIYFNRNHPVADFELGQLTNRNRVVLVTGFEERGTTAYFLRNRWNIGRNFTFLNYVSTGYQSNASEAFNNRNYKVSQVKIEAEWAWLVSENLRFGFAYKYRNGRNILINNNERIVNNDFSLESTWTHTSLVQLRARFAFIKINYVGERNTPVEFALLEGLQSGKNRLWNVSYDQTLSNSILLSVSYEGRQTGGIRAVHVGRAQVRATF
ncbi:MAG: hypothetical protein U5L45_22920 [Saprospiraceae bacterium]|nr:hypothetical protein [Saprospiraceae bacterium]